MTDSFLAVDEGLRLGEQRLLSWRWLRDHCDDPESLDPVTLQRKIDTFAIDANEQPTSCSDDHDRWTFSWNDGSQTSITKQLLVEMGDQMRSPNSSAADPAIPSGIALWPTPPSQPSAPLAHHDLDDDAAFGRWLQNLRRDGYALIDHAPAGEAALQAVADRIGYVRTTVFGAIWELAADLTDHADSAYDTTFLAPHTDGTYSHDAPGLQLFCCQERDGTGGQSILVDAFAAVADLTATQRRTLAATSVPGRYVEPGVSLLADRPALRSDFSGATLQVSVNNYDRAPFLLADQADEDAFYDAYGALHARLNDASSWLTIHWHPGQVLVIDNWRVCHGRTAFTGTRRFLGCYLNHEDFESALRLHA